MKNPSFSLVFPRFSTGKSSQQSSTEHRPPKRRLRELSQALRRLCFALTIAQLCMAQGVGQEETWATRFDGGFHGVHMTGWWYTYPSEKYEFVSWDDDIPNIWKKTCSKPQIRVNMR